MKKGKQIQINFSNRWLYALITLGILAIISVGVYALSSNTIPNPGHNISEIAPPTGCNSGNFLQFDGTKWTCAASTSSQWTTSGNNNLYYTTGNVGIGINSPNDKLDVGGVGPGGVSIYASGTNYGIYGNSPSGGIGGYFTSATGYSLITGKGNVGIGTSNPSTNLEVSGNAKIDGSLIATNLPSSYFCTYITERSSVNNGIGCPSGYVMEIVEARWAGTEGGAGGLWCPPGTSHSYDCTGPVRNKCEGANYCDFGNTDNSFCGGDPDSGWTKRLVVSGFCVQSKSI